MELDLRHGDIVTFLEEITESFMGLATKRGIELKFLNHVRELEMDFDAG